MIGWLSRARGHVWMFVIGAGAAFGALLNGEWVGVVQGALLAWWAW